MTPSLGAVDVIIMTSVFPVFELPELEGPSPMPNVLPVFVLVGLATIFATGPRFDIVTLVP